MAFAVALAAVLAVYAPVLAGMAVEWVTFPSLSHGFAVPLISAYLVWRRRELIGVEPLGSANVGLAVFVVALGIFQAGSLSGETFFSRLSFPLALLGIALLLAGPRATGRVWPAIAYLLFMIPFPYLTFKAVTYQWRLFEAGVTAKALRGLGVPILQQGVMLHLPRVTLEIADECSGVLAVAALVALGTAYAQIQPRATWMRVTLVLAAAPLGLVSNILRLVLTALGGVESRSHPGGEYACVGVRIVPQSHEALARPGLREGFSVAAGGQDPAVRRKARQEIYRRFALSVIGWEGPAWP